MKEEWRLLAKLFLANFGAHCFSNIYFLFGPFLEGRGVSPQFAGMVLSAFYVTTMLIRPLGGLALEKFGVRRTLVAAGMLCFIGSAGIAASGTHVLGLAFFRAVSGFGFGAFIVGATAYQALIVKPEIRGASFALVTAGGMAPLATIVPLSDWLIHTGHPFLYLWLAPTVALFCIGVGTLMETAKDRPELSPKTQSWGSYADLFRERGYLLLLGSMLLLALTDATSLCISSLAHAKGLIASSLLSGQAFAAVFTRLFGCRLMDRFPRPLAVGPSLSLMALCLLVASWGESNRLFFLCGLVYGVGIGVGFPVLLSLVGDLVPKNLQPKGVSLLFFIMDLAWATTPVLIGFGMALIGTEATFRLFGASALLAAAFLHYKIWRPFLRSSKREKGLH